MRIHITGASCAGSTTLGQALGKQMQFTYLDTDNYFWLPSNPPYTQKRPVEQRNAMLEQDIRAQKDLVVGGSLMGWGEDWPTLFELVVFLYIPRDIRMQRLRNRELARYGEVILTDPGRRAQSEAFYNWAYGYDDGTTNGRNLLAHEKWLQTFSCPVIRLEGDLSVQQRIDIILKYLSAAYSG